MSFRLTPRGKSFMVMSNDGAWSLLGKLGYGQKHEYKFRAAELRSRIDSLGPLPVLPKEVRANFTALEVVTRHLLPNDPIYVS
jgi:hypothetical protein